MPATTVTLTTLNTAYKIHDLITAGAGGHAFPNAARSCREISITADAGNLAAKIYVGDAKVSTTDFGAELVAGQSMTLRSDKNNISLIGKWLLSDTSDRKVDLQWEYA